MELSTRHILVYLGLTVLAALPHSNVSGDTVRQVSANLTNPILVDPHRSDDDNCVYALVLVQACAVVDKDLGLPSPHLPREEKTLPVPGSCENIALMLIRRCFEFVGHPRTML